MLLGFQTPLYFVSTSKYMVISTQTNGFFRAYKNAFDRQPSFLTSLTVHTAKSALGREVSWAWEENYRNVKEEKQGRKITGFGPAAHAVGSLWFCFSWLSDAQGFSLLLSKDQSLHKSSGSGWSENSCKDFYPAQEVALVLRGKPLLQENLNSVKESGDILRFRHIFIALI